MAGPSKVEFPGGKKQKIRLRGTKQASKDIKQRLRINLDKIVEEPENILPEYWGPDRMKWMRISPVKKALDDINKVLDKRNNQKWLKKKMVNKRTDQIARAWAGSLVAANSSDLSMVSVFKHPLYGNASYIRKGDAKATYMAGIQNHHNPRLRMLPWEEYARKGWWFFSWKDGFVCTGKEPIIIEEWVNDSLKRNPLKFSLKEEDGKKIYFTSDLEHSVVKEGGVCNQGYARFIFDEEIIVGISEKELSKKSDDMFMLQFALGVMPPKIGDFAKVEFVWKPENWPIEQDLPEGSKADVKEVLLEWMNLTGNEKSIVGKCKKAILEGLEEGFVIGEKWYSLEEKELFLGELSGGDLERRATAILLELLEGQGIKITNKGDFEFLDLNLIYVENGTMHSILSATFDEYGLDLLEKMFGANTDIAEELFEEQQKKSASFGNFLRKASEKLAHDETISKFPELDSTYNVLCHKAHSLILTAHSDGIGKSQSAAMKMKNSVSEQALAWAWLVVIGKYKGKEWKFEQAARDKGNEWVVAVENVWEKSNNLVAGNPDLSELEKEYLNSVEKLSQIMG